VLRCGTRAFSQSGGRRSAFLRAVQHLGSSAARTHVDLGVDQLNLFPLFGSQRRVSGAGPQNCRCGAGQRQYPRVARSPVSGAEFGQGLSPSAGPIPRKARRCAAHRLSNAGGCLAKGSQKLALRYSLSVSSNAQAQAKPSTTRRRRSFDDAHGHCSGVSSIGQLSG